MPDKRSPVNLALLCLMVLTRDRDDFANLDEMLPPKAMQEHYTIALNSLLLQLTPASTLQGVGIQAVVSDEGIVRASVPPKLDLRELPPDQMSKSSFKT
ncbi:uncharacterized protein ACA1_360650 [Acanthamoeba castellanii str. Neff]|uniref:Uncharacterized protein n=1 Tax=Acanthamoeba castellanii (strain ATCC 30010 / Neff) TaxID=1257118 RepID=L8HBZ5_ACACF|nr:uncharacterized protein ACA1_360650 [Acanthamoeba castellanii str. Neff]ELR23049.1 hypothetical protein ACA1_360650 [Acanthamoeba castellanii str. Neff]